ncbi:Hsp20/alpha crystallin family protein [Thermodesulfobacteriota bacterium]
MQKNIDALLSKGPMIMLDNIGKFQSRVAKILDDTLNIDLGKFCSTADFTPSADFIEKSDSFRIDMDLPGMDIKDVEITYSHDKLIVLGTRKSPYNEPVKEEGAEEGAEGTAVADKVLEKDLSFGSFERVFLMPSEIDDSRIKASYHNGVLTISIPKVKESRLKKIKIETEHKRHA